MPAATASPVASDALLTTLPADFAPFFAAIVARAVASPALAAKPPVSLHWAASSVTTSQSSL